MKIMNKFKINKSNHRHIIAGGLISAAMLLLAAVALPGSPARAAGGDAYQPVQIAQLYQLQAAFHRVASVHHLTGDDQATINQRIQDMLALWTDDAVLVLAVGSPRDGHYIGKGDLFSNCSPPSGDPNNQGTLCTFFKYVSGSFQPQNIFVSLAPSYQTQFQVVGNTAMVYFECHYFDVSGSPPAWTARSHVGFMGSARNVDGQWLFSDAYAQVPPVPIP
jgi:hypothetical protein